MEVTRHQIMTRAAKSLRRRAARLGGESAELLNRVGEALQRFADEESAGDRGGPPPRLDGVKPG